MISRRHGRLADCSRALRRHRLVMLTTALVLAIATALALRELSDIYESKMSLIITSPKVDGAFDLSGRLSAVRQQITSREALEAVISKHILSVDALEATISQMRERILIELEAPVATVSSALESPPVPGLARSSAPEGPGPDAPGAFEEPIAISNISKCAIDPHLAARTGEEFFAVRSRLISRIA